MLKQSVAIGVVLNSHQQVLISKRNKNQHLAGYWELPGGKVSPDESFKLALRRELAEELAIEVCATVKIFEFNHQYEDRVIHFHVYKVLSYLGDPQSNEDQEIRWANIQDLNAIKFPHANKAVIDAIVLPKFYMIADEVVFGDSLIESVEKQLRNGVKILQHRAAQHTQKSAYLCNALRIKQLCDDFGAKYLMNAPLEWMQDVNPHGIHLSSCQLRRMSQGEMLRLNFELFSASCHNEEEVKVANQLGVRCLLIGSVNQTKSHPDTIALGWKKFSQLCAFSNVPVYALGGLCLADYKNAVVSGGQGIAAIRAFID